MSKVNTMGAGWKFGTGNPADYHETTHNGWTVQVVGAMASYDHWGPYTESTPWTVTITDPQGRSLHKVDVGNANRAIETIADHLLWDEVGDIWHSWNRVGPITTNKNVLARRSAAWAALEASWNAAVADAAGYDADEIARLDLEDPAIIDSLWVSAALNEHAGSTSQAG